MLRGEGNAVLAQSAQSAQLRDLSSLPGLVSVEAGVGGWAAGKGASGDSWSGDRAQFSEGLDYLGQQQSQQ